MKLSTTREHLLAALSKVNSTPTKSPMPIITECLVKVSETGETLLIGTDLETTQTVHLPDVWETTPGIGTLAPKAFTSIIKATPKGSHVSLSWNKENRCKIETLDPNGDTINSFSLECQDPVVFPQVPKFETQAERIELPASWLIEQIKNASVYASNDELRPQLCGLHLVADAGKLSIDATDGHRLFHVQRDINSSASASAIFDKRAAQTLVKSLVKIAKESKQETLVELWLAQNTDQQTHSVQVCAPHFRHYSCAIEGRYPNVSAVVPTEEIAGLLFADVSEMNTALTQARALVNKDAPQVRLSLNRSVQVIVENVCDGKESKQTLPRSTFAHRVESKPPRPDDILSEYLSKIKFEIDKYWGSHKKVQHFAGVSEFVKSKHERVIADVLNGENVHERQEYLCKYSRETATAYYIGSRRVRKSEFKYAEFVVGQYSNQFDVGLNPVYIQDILSTFPSDSVRFEFRSPTRAVVIKSDALPNQFALLMPVRLA